MNWSGQACWGFPGFCRVMWLGVSSSGLERHDGTLPVIVPRKRNLSELKARSVTGHWERLLHHHYHQSKGFVVWVQVLWLLRMSTVLFPFVFFFQARLHNGQSITVLTSWKVSSTGIPTRNHTSGASWKQDSSQMKLKEGLNVTLHWKHGSIQYKE